MLISPEISGHNYLNVRNGRGVDMELFANDQEQDERLEAIEEWLQGLTASGSETPAGYS